jgi:hypothetical protein
MKLRRKVLEKWKKSKRYFTKRVRWMMAYNSAEVRRKNRAQLE